MLLSCPLLLLAPAVLPAPQNGAFGDEWLGFRRDDSLLVAGANVGLSDDQEKDYGVGDFDRDGRPDLVCVRKRPLDEVGLRRNVLFMNEGGLLVDRTAEYGSNSDVPGDQGLLAQTNDRDVVVTDVDLDGWLDLVTATTLSPGQSKPVSHPRVYMNLGEDGGGAWLGFRYEEARIPQLLLAGGASSWPRFTSVAAGDVTGDGYPDLYFGDNDKNLNQGGGDMNDRLLVNDGTGHFADEGTLRVGDSELDSFYTTSVAIEDLNGDGAADLIRNRGYYDQVAISYNDPANVGTFNLHTVVQQTEPYFVSVGDLNRDDQPDLVCIENVDDTMLFNQGPNGPQGSVDWSAAQTFEFLTGSDEGFSSDTYIHDFDLDGWNDVLVCDYDIEIPDCSRYTHLYHNLGGDPGAIVSLQEEAESANNGWRGAVGLDPAVVRGVHDAGILDIDGDGDDDIVFGHCTGTMVYLNTTIDGDPVGLQYCGCDAGTAPCGNPGEDGRGCANSTGVGALLAAHGSRSVAADDLSFASFDATPSQPGLLFVGTTPSGGGSGVPFGDGLQCAGGGIVRLEVRFTTLAGLAVYGPGLGGAGGWSPGDTRYFQVWYRDPSGGPCSSGFNLSSAVRVSFTQ